MCVCILALSLCSQRNLTDYTVEVPGLAQKKIMPCLGDWNIIMRRENDIEDFDRTWTEYTQGFGDPVKDFWLGNQVSFYIIQCW